MPSGIYSVQTVRVASERLFVPVRTLRPHDAFHMQRNQRTTQEDDLKVEETGHRGEDCNDDEHLATPVMPRHHPMFVVLHQRIVGHVKRASWHLSVTCMSHDVSFSDRTNPIG